MNAPHIEGVVLTHEFKAHLYEYRPLFSGKKHVLHVGLPFWEALDAPEKVALVAHELGHLINGDPSRGGLIAYAQNTLERWLYWFSPLPHVNADRDVEFGEQLMRFLLWIFGAFVTGLWLLLHWTTRHHSQISGYTADAASVRVAGKHAVQQTLRRGILEPEWERATRGLDLEAIPEDGWLISHIASEIRNTPPERIAKHEQHALKEHARIDESHPPTIYRLGFVEDLEEPEYPMILDDTLLAQISLEFSATKDDLGAALLIELKHNKAQHYS